MSTSKATAKAGRPASYHHGDLYNALIAATLELIPISGVRGLSLREVARRAKDVDASFLGAHPLFLKSCSRPTYLNFVREHFPQLLKSYEQRFARADFVEPQYRKMLAERVLKVCREFGLKERSTDALLTRDVGEPPGMAERYREERYQKGPSDMSAPRMRPRGVQAPAQQQLLFA